jgi:hypothetical protein
MGVEAVTVAARLVAAAARGEALHVETDVTGVVQALAGIVLLVAADAAIAEHRLVYTATRGDAFASVVDDVEQRRDAILERAGDTLAVAAIEQAERGVTR